MEENSFPSSSTGKESRDVKQHYMPPSSGLPQRFEEVADDQRLQTTEIVNSSMSVESRAVMIESMAAPKNIAIEVKYDPFSNPIYQATYDFGCGCTIALMVAAKIFTFSILVFQASPAVISLRSSVTNAAAIGVMIMTVIIMCKSRYPYIVIVPDMFSAPYLIQMSYQLSDEIEDEKAASVTILVLVLLVFSLSAILHILMASFKMLRFAEFLPYPVFCGLFSAVGLTILQRSVLFAPGYQIIPTFIVAISLSLKIFKSKETRPALTFAVISIVGTAIFYVVSTLKGISVDELRKIGWLVERPEKSKNLAVQLVPWLLWTGGSAHVKFESVQWSILILKCGSSIGLLLILIALRRSMQLANLNRLFSCRAKTNHELALHGYSQLFAASLGTFGGVFSGPDMVRVKRMHGGEVFPGVISVLALVCITLAQFMGVDYIPKFIFTGILASEGIMMLDRFLLMPYRLAGFVEWFAVVIIAVTAFFDIFKGFFIGAAISLMLFSVRFYRTGCVKMTGTGLTIRSTVDRSDTASDWLSSHGEKIRVVQLRGTVAFANVPTVLNVVADILDINHDKSKPLNTPQAKFLVWLRALKNMIRIKLSSCCVRSFTACFRDDNKSLRKYHNDDDGDYGNHDDDIGDVSKHSEYNPENIDLHDIYSVKKNVLPSDDANTFSARNVLSRENLSNESLDDKSYLSKSSKNNYHNKSANSIYDHENTENNHHFNGNGKVSPRKEESFESRIGNENSTYRRPPNTPDSHGESMLEEICFITAICQLFVACQH
jgi:MFS superfamily sulfate permease-like transporter